MSVDKHDVWAVGEGYDRYVARWSRVVAAEFVRWLGVDAGARWLDVGCGTGALAGAIVAGAQPSAVVGVDLSEGFLGVAKARNPGVEFHVGDARAIPLGDNEFDAVVSGLALNFVPEPARAVGECARVAKHGGLVAAYVWDYAEGMEMMRYFWDAAVELDPEAEELDEGRRFSMCRPEGLRELWAGMGEVAVEPIDIPTIFEGFDDYWRPFLGGQGSAPGYAMSLSEDRRSELRERLRETLGEGEIRLTARAWAVRGRVS
ncbi:MAG TPA: class I SAM-dependent methyltransferase [Candidatus Limnocylindrales bacterium]|nr:class I SAM-dependent methyltransferase [Candidatus Limnocylindrales bacterium]